MAGKYHPDLTEYSLESFRLLLETQEMLPSRRILQEDISARFAALDAAGIRNLGTLVEALKTPAKMKAFSAATGLRPDYLTILLRHVKSLAPSPMSLKAVPGVDPIHVERLSRLKINNAKQLFERSITPWDRASLSADSGVPPEALLELVRLSDTARAGYVGPILSRLFLEAGVDSLETLAGCRADELFARLVATNRKLKLTKASFTEKDITGCIDTAKTLPYLIKY